MSTAPAPNPPAAPASPTPAPAAAPPHSWWRWPRRAILLIVVAAAAVFVVPPAAVWVKYRSGHSLTDDAFVETHIVNIAPEAVAGRVVRFTADENDRVEAGQVLAEIDPTPYRDQVELAKAKLATAEAELKRQEIALARLKLDVPLQIEIARRTRDAARADRAKADESVKVTEDEVERGIEEAKAALDAATADLALAQIEYDRFADLFKQNAVPQRKWDEVTRTRDAAAAHVRLAEAKLAKAKGDRGKIQVTRKTLEAAETGVGKAEKSVDLATTGNEQIAETEQLAVVKRQTVEEARRGLVAAENTLGYTKIRAPFPGVVVRRARNLGDFASPGVAVLSLYNPDLLYVTANLEETRLRGVAPGNGVRLDIDAFSEPFRGRVVWVNKSTGAQFSLMPRNVVSGEFTKVVQRVPVRIAIEKDDRWPQLRAGLSVRVAIEHGPGDPAWAETAAREMTALETKFNLPTSDAPKPTP
ncbi:HlyD family secretion protein [Fimbriiglobus ruber]|uniref:Multidrug resistance protein [function not yet clear] n=1 Tax=Fimbriiglobus ruber TaxID=1908690 RepID=A0A225DB55_9BACT|nr:HlyD family secretion protein [Fimbriiglobus ruber]OWK38213.1 Multidrug resistance protein [function not yet clear] [Fimbriiglobus ruber]